MYLLSAFIVLSLHLNPVRIMFALKIVRLVRINPLYLTSQPIKYWKHISSVPKPSVKNSSKKKWGYAFGTSIVVPGLWYFQADNQKKRKARVTVQGIGRFLR